MKCKFLILFCISALIYSCSSEEMSTEVASPEEKETHGEEIDSVSVPIDSIVTLEEKFHEVVIEYPDSVELEVKEIDRLVDSINTYLTWEDEESIMLEESAEGGELRIYKHASGISLVEEHHYGEMGQQLNLYYLANEVLIYTEEATINYSHPYYVEDELGPVEIDTVLLYSYFYESNMFRRFEDGDCGAPFDNLYKFEEQNRIYDRLNELFDLDKLD